ncbi:LexA family protein [Streptomyces tauricus]|uniref:LexA family protein n=1 Tax=Streptomyces tauricus TaxID=68274 RepID=UPI0022448AF3|nr:hypothetical protein [Streptomyces tauricus]MCW8102721.1 hypothetical protein [Streptomyces tauricus]
MTEREEQILACIRESIADRGQGPTMAEIGVAVGLCSRGTVAYHLRNLQEQLPHPGRGDGIQGTGHDGHLTAWGSWPGTAVPQTRGRGQRGRRFCLV